jgi:hypothetical protein
LLDIVGTALRGIASLVRSLQLSLGLKIELIFAPVWFSVLLPEYRHLPGGGELSEKDESDRVSLPNEAWAQGPEFANASISRLVV